jgi:hypothetical protein
MKNIFDDIKSKILCGGWYGQAVEDDVSNMPFAISEDAFGVEVSARKVREDRILRRYLSTTLLESFQFTP